MASVDVPASQEDMHPQAKTVPARWDPSLDAPRSNSPELYRDEEARPMRRRSSDSDSISDSISLASAPNSVGRKLFAVADESVTTVYEAYELLAVEGTHMRQSWKSFCGITYSTKWVNRDDDGCLVLPVLSFEQGELADLHEDAIRSYRHTRTSYEQDLANRVADLPTGFQERLFRTVFQKTQAVNENPYRKRECRMVVFQPCGSPLTEASPDPKRSNIFSRKRQPGAIRKWLVVIRIQEVKSTKEDGGWRNFGRDSNPWSRFDRQETKEEREHHKEIARMLDRRENRRPRPQSQSGPRGPSPNSRQMPMDRR